MGRSWLVFLVALGACLGAGRGFLGASAQVVHQHTKIAPFRLFGAIAFLHPFNKSVLRGFLGGFFGFIGARCIFDWLVAFVGLVGLYACRVKRLESEKRKPANFLALAFACIASLLFFVGFACAAWVALCVLLVVFSLLGCVGGGSFSLWTI